MKRVRGILAGSAAILIAACGGGDAEETAVVVDEPAAAAPVEAPAVPSGPPAAPAVAIMLDRNGNEVGRSNLRQEGNEVVIEVNARNLEGGEKGVHIHGVGVCEGPAFTSAGDHFNPGNRQHGLTNPEGPHAGDLPNLHIDPDDGIARETFRTDRVTLQPGQPNSLLGGTGTALVIHAAADDGTTQPSGNSGDRVVCGVIAPA